MKPRTPLALALLTLAATLPPPPTHAGVPEPDTVVFGSIALDGQYITATNSSVSVELRATPDGPPLRSYQMGSSPRAGNLYVLRARAESNTPLLQPGSLPLGATAHVVVRDLSGVRDSKSLVLSERGGFVRIDFGDVDSDGDGMSDAFESTYFGGPNSGNPLLDSDGDGRPNLREFLDQTNPLVPDGRHPADISPANDAIGIAEVTAYTLAWQLGEEWSVEPKVIPVDYVTRAGALWKGGEVYVFDNDPATNAPMWWVNAPPPAPAPAPALHDDTPDAESSPTPARPNRRLLTSTASTTSTPNRVTRSGPANFTPAQPATVRIHISPSTSTLSFAVEETPPQGWILRNVSHGGRIDRVHQKIKWGPFYDAEPRDLSYEVTPLPGTSSPAAFSGVGSFNGTSTPSDGLLQMLPPGVVPPPALVSVATGNGQFQLQLTGIPNTRYLIEASANLQVWTPVQTVTTDNQGALVHSLSQLGLGQRFFRARTAD